MFWYISQPTAQSAPAWPLAYQAQTALNLQLERLVPTVQGQVPHVFGMTASPVNMNAQDSTTKMAQAVKQLEGNLDAEVGLLCSWVTAGGALGVGRFGTIKCSASLLHNGLLVQLQHRLALQQR